MTLKNLIHSMNDDLTREYQHMLFYTHAANMLVGLGRLYLLDTLKKHAASEMGHVFQFAEKIRANGVVPKNGGDAPAFCNACSSVWDIISCAISLEEEVVKHYHERHKQATKLYEETGRHYDLVIFIEEQIEHSQADIDELRLILA